MGCKETSSPLRASPGAEGNFCSISVSHPALLTLVAAGFLSRFLTLLSPSLLFLCSCTAAISITMIPQSIGNIHWLSSGEWHIPFAGSCNWLWADVGQLLGSVYKGHPCSPQATKISSHKPDSGVLFISCWGKSKLLASHLSVLQSNYLSGACGIKGRTHCCLCLYFCKSLQLFRAEFNQELWSRNNICNKPLSQKHI